MAGVAETTRSQLSPAALGIREGLPLRCSRSERKWRASPDSTGRRGGVGLPRVVQQVGALRGSPCPFPILGGGGGCALVFSAPTSFFYLFTFLIFLIFLLSFLHF